MLPLRRVRPLRIVPEGRLPILEGGEVMQKVRNFFTTLIAVILYIAVVAVIALFAIAICSFLINVIARCWLWA